MHTDNGRVDHLYSCVMGACRFVHNLAPDAHSPPANEAIVAGGVGTKAARQVPSRRSRPQHPKDAVEALRTGRSFTRATPRGFSGSIGLMATHSWSVS
jgi:hypothetical protein